MKILESCGLKALLLLLLVSFSTVDLPGQDSEDLQIRPVDVVELTNGNKFEGRILSERSNSLQMETTGGTVTLDKADIVRVLYRNPPEKVYQVKLRRELDETSYESQLSLGRWCLDPQVDLPSEAILHLELANRIDPDKESSYSLLFPLYDVRDTSAFTTEELSELLMREMTVLFAGIRVDQRRGDSSFAVLADVKKRASTLLWRMGHPQGAILLLQDMSEGDLEDPQVAWALRELVVMLDSLGRSTESRAAAMKLRTIGGGTDAEVLLREISWASLDHAAGVEGAREKIESLVADLVENGGDVGQGYLYRGSARLLDDDLQGAEDDFKNAFQAGMVDASAATTFALSFARQGFFAKALGLLGAAASSDAVPVDWRLVEAYILESQGDIEGAVDLYSEAGRQDGALWQAKLLAVEARRRNETDWDPTVAIQQVMRSDVLTPAAFAECSLILGDHSLRKGQLPQARRWLEYAISSGYAGPDLLLRVAMAQRGPGGDPVRAREALMQVVELDPGNVDAWNALAEFQHRSGDLASARDSIEMAMSLYPEKLRNSSSPDIPAPLRWAQRSLRRIDRTLQEEYWFDDFQREADSAIRNNWLEEEAYGVSVSLHDGSVFFEGTQKYQPDRLTTMKREILTPRLTGIRSTIRLLDSGPGTRVALRIEDQSGGGLIFYRDPDGVLGFAILGGSKVEMIRSDDLDNGEEYDLVTTSWPSGKLAHELEITFTEDGREGAEVWFDGVRVARGVPYRPARKRGLVGGISGQAPIDEVWGLEIESFEVFRRKAVVTQDREF
ncbi:MAG: tetratricopeptide repeat protein [Planctomycetota bacterium]